MSESRARFGDHLDVGLQGKTAVLIGAGPGIGQAVAHAFVAADCTTVVTDVILVAAERTCDMLGPKAEPAARAMLLAAERGRNGERYIVSDRYLSIRELHEIAATAVGRRPPRVGIPMPVLRAGARVNDLLARLLGRDLPFAYVGMRMAELMSPLDHGKAQRELGWTPEPVEDSIRKAAVFFASRG
jgi:NAD(P)-dependent dehydrogenase (short-subunit alcohol dehydrogenase family)